MTNKDLAIIPETSKYINPAPRENQGKVIPSVYYKDKTIVEYGEPIAGVLGGLPALLGTLFGIAGLAGGFGTVIPEAALILTGSSAVLGAGTVFTFLKLNKLAKKAHKAFVIESERVKNLLYSNFGRAAGITPAIIRSSTFRNNSWVYNDEKFFVTYDDETAIYSFGRSDFFEGVEVTQPKDSFYEELKPFFLKLKAADIPEDAAVLAKNLTSSVSKLMQSNLGVEQKYDVKRLVVDAAELIRMSSELAVYDAASAEKKLVEGLRSLSSDAKELTETERELLTRQIDSYNTYVGTRSIGV